MSEKSPKGWFKKKLGELSSPAITKSTSNNQFEPLTSSRGGLVRQRDYFTKQVTSEDNTGYRVVSNGDFTFRAMSDDGTFKFNRSKFRFDGIVSPAYEVFRAQNCDGNYLSYILDSDAFSKKIYAFAQGGTRLALKYSKLAEIELPIPPLPEQKKIASILTSVDEVTKNTKQKIDKLQDLKKATINELMSNGIGHTEFKDNELGRIPKSWERRKLGKLGKFSKGKGISKSDLVSQGLPCLRYAEIYTDYEFLITELKSRIPKEIADGSKRLTSGDIVFAGSGETVEEIGKSVAYLSESEAYVGGDAVILTPTVELDSAFLSYQLNDDERRKQLRKMGQGSSVIHIYSSELEKLRLDIPPLPEQKKIVSILSSVNKDIETKYTKLQQIQSLKEALMQDLLTGKVRVKVN